MIVAKVVMEIDTTRSPSITEHLAAPKGSAFAFVPAPLMKPSHSFLKELNRNDQARDLYAALQYPFDGR
jgi:hypothetical protein